MLSATGLSAWYGQTRALWDIDLRVGSGEIVGILGRNGAGKTTLVRTLAGLQARAQGEVTLNGVPIQGIRPHLITLRGLTLVREGGKMAASLTVDQHLELANGLARARQRALRPLADVWRAFPLLEQLRDRRAGLLSGGQRQALALAIAYMSNPLVMILDEPSAGLAPQVAHELFQNLKGLAGEGITILVVEQHPAWLVGFAQRGYLLEVGRIVAEGDVATVIKRSRAEDGAVVKKAAQS
jgi:branched-chain amino acid transport system ATP-binding protein